MADKKPDVFKAAQLYIKVVPTLDEAAKYAAVMQQADQGFDGAEIYEAAKIRVFNKAGTQVIAEKDSYVVVVWDNASA